MKFKKLLLQSFVALSMLLTGSSASAQVSDYTFAQSSGTYVPITGGTVLATATALSGAVPSLDSYVDSVSTFPFAFTFNSVAYTKCYVSSNGFISFGTGAPTTGLSTPISSTAAVLQGVVAAWARDINAVYNLGSPARTGEMRYETIGTAPNRQLVIQWSNFRPAYTTSATSAFVFDFQIILEETTNKVYVKYGGDLAFVIGSSSQSGTAQVGLRGATATDYNNRLNPTSALFTASTTGTANGSTQAFNTTTTPPGMPTSGLTYTWTPGTCPGPSGVTVSAFTTSGGTLNWTAPSSLPASGYEYEVRTSGAAGSGTTGLAASGTAATTATSTSITGLSSATSYTVYLRSSCGSGDFGSWIAGGGFTTLCDVVAAPFYEGFNSGSLPNCWTNSNSISSTTANLLWRFSGTPDYGALPNGRPAGTYTWIDASSPYNAVVTLSSPIIDLSALTTPYLKFDWFKNNTDPTSGHTNNNLMVEGYNGTAWVTLFNDTANSNAWRTVGISLPSSFAGATNAQFRFSVDKSLSNNFYDDLLLDSVAVISAPTCFAPTGVMASATSTSGTTLSWTAPGTAPSSGYQYEVRSSGAAGSGTTGLAASGTTGAGVLTASVSGLNPATTYTVYVRGNCGTTDGYSEWTSAYTFTTACLAINVPYAENFDGVTVPALPGCSVVQDVNGDGTTWKTATSSPSSTPNVLAYTYNTANPANDWWFAPGLNLTSGTVYQIKFKYRGSGTSFPEKLEIKAGTAPEAAAMTGTALWSDVNIVNTTYQTTTINFTATTTGVHYFGWHVFSAANMNYLYVDDITIDVAPSCLPPTGITASSISFSGATIGWTASASSPANGYEYEVRSSGAAGSGTTGLAASGTTGAGVLTASVSGLNPTTTYSVYVRSNCGTGDYSTWTLAYTFTTPCAAVAAPFYEGFNSGSLPNCWTNSNSISSTTANLLWKFSGAPGYGTAANGRPNGSFAWLDASSPYNAVVTLSSPIIDLSALTTPYLKFDWFKNNTSTTTGYTNNNLMVEGYNGTAWVTLFNDTANSNAWRTVGISLPSSFAGATNAQFRFSVDKSLSNDYYDDLLLDSVAVINAPTCFAPTGVMASATSTSGTTLSWTAPGTAPSSGYQYEVRSSGAAGSGTTGLAASGTTGAGVLTASVSGLNPATTYTVYVRGNCGTTDGYSEWTAAYTFTTACLPLNVPYLQNFDAVTVPALPGCSIAQDVNGDANTWKTIGSNPNSAPNALVYVYNANPADDWWFTPGLNLTSGTTYNITFAYRAYSASFAEKMEVKVGNAQSVSAMTGTALWSDTNIVNTSYLTTTISYTPTSTGVFYFGWHAFSEENQWNLYVDDIAIELGSTCVDPTVMLGNDTTICEGASVTLDAGNPGASYLWSNGATSQTINATAGGTYSVAVTVTGGCVGYDTITVTVNPLPVVDLGADTAICAGTSLTLDAGNAGATYAWSTGDNTQTTIIDMAGTYSVAVTSAGCTVTDTVTVTMTPLPVVDLGMDTSICLDATLTLDAGNTGASFTWSTGDTTQTITVTEAGTYSVMVENGACAAMDTIMIEEATAPVAATIEVVDNMPDFEFSAPGTTGAVIYAWDFGDGATATTETASHTYTANGTYTVTLIVTSACGQTGSVTTTVTVSGVGVDAVNAQASLVQVYPNPSSGLTVVEAKGATIKTLEVVDNLGRVVLRSQPATAKASFDVKGMAQGIYTIRVQTSKGLSTLKLVVKD